jgi:long-chain acyl-CoA synthetase
MSTPQTIPELLEHAAALWQDRPYLVSRTGNVVSCRSYGQVLELVQQVAGGLIEQGVRPQDRIALLSENRAEWVIVYFSILAAGAVVIPLDALMSLSEVRNIIKESGARTLIVSQKLQTALNESGSSIEGIERTFLLDATALENLSLPRKAGVALPKIDPDNVAVIIFTSGTTGHSKGVVLTHNNLCSNVEGIRSTIHTSQHDNFFMLLPLNHTFSSTVSMLCPLACGASVTLATSYKSRDILDDIRLCGVTLLPGVPQVYENIMAGIKRAVAEAGLAKRVLFNFLYFLSSIYERFGIPAGRLLFRSLRKKAGLDSLWLMISGGAALRTDLNHFFARLGFTLIQGYGLTETSPVLSVNLPHCNRIGSVGPALKGVEIKIANPDKTGIGEICARGPNVMQGYFENPEATAEVLKEGWFYTGDAGYLDRHSYLYITGRLKNVIITGAGKNVYPEEIESRLNASPFILESLVLGVERKRGTGEELYALVVPDKIYVEGEQAAGKAVDLQNEIKRVVDEYNSSVPQYRQIRQWQLREEEFTKTSSRKIKRFLYKNSV